MKEDAQAFNRRMGGWMKQLRINQKLSQGDIAAAVKVHRNTIAKYENGTGVTLWMYLRIAEALKVAPELPPRW